MKHSEGVPTHEVVVKMKWESGGVWKTVDGCIDVGPGISPSSVVIAIVTEPSKSEAWGLCGGGNYTIPSNFVRCSLSTEPSSWH